MIFKPQRAETSGPDTGIFMWVLGATAFWAAVMLGACYIL